MNKEIPIVKTEFKKELRHLCTNTQICKKFIQPNKDCKDCKYHIENEVDVALQPIRLDVDWGY